jgi:hypothetical protein
MKPDFTGGFSENTQITNLIKSHPVGAELFYVDGRTDKNDEANIRFSQFCERAYEHYTYCCVVQAVLNFRTL